MTAINYDMMDNALETLFAGLTSVEEQSKQLKKREHKVGEVFTYILSMREKIADMLKEYQQFEASLSEKVLEIEGKFKALSDKEALLDESREQLMLQASRVNSREKTLLGKLDELSKTEREVNEKLKIYDAVMKQKEDNEEQLRILATEKQLLNTKQTLLETQKNQLEIREKRLQNNLNMIS